MKKRSRMTFGVLVAMALMTVASPAVAEEVDVRIPIETTVSAIGGGTAAPRSNFLVWRYKVENGHFWKRLYNASTGRWETDWILVE